LRQHLLGRARAIDHGPGLTAKPKNSRPTQRIPAGAQAARIASNYGRIGVTRV